MSIDIFELLANSKVKKKFPGKIRKKSETFEKLKCWPPCISFCAISQTHLKYWFSVKNYVIWLNSMKFIFYCYAVSLMPEGAWWHFWQWFNKIWWYFWQKMNVLEISSPQPVTLIGSKIFQNVPECWRNCEFCTPSSTKNRSICFQLIYSRLWLLQVCFGDKTLVLDYCCLKCYVSHRRY